MDTYEVTGHPSTGWQSEIFGQRACSKITVYLRARVKWDIHRLLEDPPARLASR